MQKEKKRPYTSITVKDDLFTRIKRIAAPRGMSAAEVVDDLVAYYERSPIPLRVDLKPTEAQFGWEWPGPYLQIVTDPRVKHYKSTAWIRSKEYVSTVGRPQWGPDIMKRLEGAEEFTIEKIVVVSPKAWEQKEVWKWIAHWHMASVAYEERVKYFVVKQEKAKEKMKKYCGIEEAEEDEEKRKEYEKYLDMGIYGDRLVGFLTINEKSEPQEYHTYSFPHSKIEDAEEAFKELTKCQLPWQAYKEKLGP